MPPLTLNNGTTIPAPGFGTWRADGETARRAVSDALTAGYRHLDTASFYGNQRAVGEAVRQSGLRRDEVFVTSKLWNDDHGYRETHAAFEKTLDELGFDYLDLYLIHWPIPFARRNDWQISNTETWRAFEELYEAGKIRALGVSNFRPHHLRPLLERAKIRPAVDQIEFHPGQNQSETLDFCRKNDILVEAWAPLGRGATFENPTLREIASAHLKSVAQICLRWEWQLGVLPLPKSVTPERIRENFEIFSFELSESDMCRISELEPMARTRHDPDDLPF